MTVTGVEFKFVESPGLRAEALRLLTERAFAFKRVQHDALQQIAQRNVVVIRQRLQDFNNPLFHADAGLNTFNFGHGSLKKAGLLFWYHGNNWDAGDNPILAFAAGLTI